MSECAEELFFQMVEGLKEIGEIKYEHLFVDGTKIEANANKYSFVWKKSANKFESRVRTKIEEVTAALSQEHGILCADEESLLNELESRMTTPFVHGRGHRKTELQRDIE